MGGTTSTETPQEEVKAGNPLGFSSIFPQTVWPHLVVSYVRAVVADPYSTKAPSSTEVSRETWSWDV